MPKRVLIITDSYPPEIRSASHLMQEMAGVLVKLGWDVTVITTWPRYNLPKDYAEQTMEPLMDEQGVRVLRVKTLANHKVNYLYRGLAEVLMPWLMKRKLKKYGLMHFDTIISYSPPLMLALLGAWIKKKTKARFILNVQDLFPQNAIDLGVIKNKFIIHFFREMEKYIYRTADKITLHSKNNLMMLAALYPAFKEKMSVLPNWVDLAAFNAKKSSINFREQFGLQDKCITVFPGVMGPAQGLDFILALAKKLQPYNKFHFLFVGDGSARADLINQSQQLGLDNVTFADFIPKAAYPDLLKSCDLGLVSLSVKNKTPVVPGKLQTYMAAGLPVVAALNKESDGHYLVEASQCGVNVVSGDLDSLESFYQKILINPSVLTEWGKRGREYAFQHFDQAVCVKQLIK